MRNFLSIFPCEARTREYNTFNLNIEKFALLLGCYLLYLFDAIHKEYNVKLHRYWNYTYSLCCICMYTL